MGRKKDKQTIEEAAYKWLDELESEIVPNVLTKGERKSYSKQARVLRGALERHSARQQRKAAAATGTSGEPAPADGQARANLALALSRTVPGQEPM